MKHFIEVGEDDPLPPRDYLRVKITDIEEGRVCAYAVHTSIARQCRLLDAALDESDVYESETPSLISSPHINNINACTSISMSDISVDIPQCSRRAIHLVFKYLELTTTRIPSILSRPLKAPLEELVKPWEMEFLLSDTLEEKGNYSKHQPLLEVMRVADFLIIDPLRIMLCFPASIVMKCATETEILNTIGMERAATDAELSTIYQRYPFLKGD